jgi:hypothetical protein
MSEPPKNFVEPGKRLSGQDWSEVAKTGLASMAPADKGWVLAVVIIIFILQGVDYLNGLAQADRFENAMERMSEYLNLVEQDRKEMSIARTGERKSLLHIVGDLIQTITRQANRDGRAETANQAVMNALEAQRGGE